MALTIIGVAFTVGHEIENTDGARLVWIGSAAVLLSAATGSICSVLYRPYLGKYPPLHLGALAMVASVLALALAALFSGRLDPLPSFDRSGWLAVLFIGACSGLGYFLWLWALQATTPDTGQYFSGVEPDYGPLHSVAWFWATSVSALFVAGLISVAVGLAIAHWPHQD